MTELAGDGVAVSLPPGWEGRITGRAAESTEAVTAAHAAGAAEPAERTIVLQVATFPLPAGVGDFGGGATPTMRPTDVLVVLFEYGSASVGTALFAAQGMPRLRPIDADPATLRMSIPGQSAIQRFFTMNGRAFCLYVVLGSHRRRIGQVGAVNELLRTVQVS